MNNLTQLKKLSLGCNRIREVFPSINKLVNLEVLNLQGNLIDSLTNFPKIYTSLNTLSLSGNPIHKDPEQSINNLVLPSSMKELYFNNVGLTRIPDSIKHFDQLVKLEIQNNSIVFIPKWINNKKYFNLKDLI